AAGLGHTPPILLAAGVGYDQPEFANMGDAALGSMSLSYTVPEMREEFAPGLKEFKDLYQERYGEQPVTHGLQTFATATAFFQMIDAAGTTDLDKIRETMKSTVIERGQLPNYWGVKFDDRNVNLYADPLIIGQWVPGDDGKPVYKVVYPEELAVEEPAAGLGHTPPILLAAGVGYDQPEFANMGDAALGSMSLSYTVPEMREEFAPGLKEFKDLYQERYGEQPVTHGLQTFATATAFFQMIDAAGTTDLDKIRETMKSTVIERGQLPNYWGVKFDDRNVNLYADPLIIGQWVPGDDGKPVYKVVYPEELAVEEPVIPFFK
ncbi:Leu/Ile/Val-binding protein homolog 7, partial [Durusdinium trenchii]